MPPKKKAANGYKFAEPLPKGIILEDIGKKKWRLGPSIGKGGFGEIYAAQEESTKGDKYPYVVKIEPHSNGPLFVEINFYIRYAKLAEVEEYKRSKSFKTFGMPVYYGSGSHVHKEEKYRFLVMDKFSTDLYKLFLENNNVFPTHTVFKVAIQILDVLEYIHGQGYVHADIKPANILLGATKETLNKQVYLVDFGLATKFFDGDTFKPNPKKAHDGTIEFLSRDAHLGVQTRRGDMEILLYNIIQWLGGTLPWEVNLTDPKLVQKSKEDSMATSSKLIKSCFGSKSPPEAFVEFLKYFNSLKFNTQPDYSKIRKIFTAGVKEAGGSLGTVFRFSDTEKQSGAKGKKRGEPEENGQPLKRRAPAKKGPARRGKPLGECLSDADDEIPPEYSNGKTSTNLNKNMSVSHNDLHNNNLKRRAPAKRGPTRQGKSPSKFLSDTDDEMPPEYSNGKAGTKYLSPKDLSRQRRAPVPGGQGKPLGSDCLSDTDEMPAATRTKKVKTNLNKRKSFSHNDLSNIDPFAGCTEAMKEIMLKKINKTKAKAKKKVPKPVLPDVQEDMVGFTDEMKEVANRKRTKKENVEAAPMRATRTGRRVKYTE